MTSGQRTGEDQARTRRRLRPTARQTHRITMLRMNRTCGAAKSATSSFTQASWKEKTSQPAVVQAMPVSTEPSSPDELVLRRRAPAPSAPCRR